MKTKSASLISTILNYRLIKSIIGFFLSLFIVAGNGINRTNDSLNIVYWLTMIPVFVFVYLFLTVIYFCFDRLSAKKCSDKTSSVNTVKIFMFSFLLLMIIYSIEYLAFYPGMFNYDGPDQLNMYLNNTISEANPLIHTLIIGKIIETVYSLGFDVDIGIAVYTIFQYTVITLCFSYMLRFIYKKCGRLIWIISVLFLSLFPTVTLQVMSSTKDAFFMGFFTLFITLTLEVYPDSGIVQKGRIKTFLWILSAFFILVFRNNCILAFPILIVLLLVHYKDKKRIVLNTLCIILIFLCYKFVFVRAYVNVPYDTRELFSVPAQQMAAIYLDDSSELTDKDKEVIEKFVGKNLEYYIPEIADLTKISLDMQFYHENSGLVWSVWRNAVIHNPQKAVQALARLNCGFWYPIYDLTSYWDGTKGYWAVGSRYPFYVKSKCVPLTKFYLWFSTTDFSNKPLIPIYLIFAPATFFYVFIINFGYALTKKRKAYVVALTFTLLYWSTFLLGPVALVRYATYLYAIVPLYFPLIVKENK